MFSLHFSSLVKYLIGIFFLQGTTGLIVYAALKTDLTQTWPLYGALGVTVAAMTALWFSSIATGARKESLAKAQASFSREKEQLRVRVEQEKIREIKNTQRQAQRQQQRARFGSQAKTGLIIAGGVGAGLLLLMTQMISLGVLALSTAGGAAIGYGVRARQERLASGEGDLLRLGRRAKPVRVLEAGSQPQAITQNPRPVGTERGWETE